MRQNAPCQRSLAHIFAHKILPCSCVSAGRSFVCEVSGGGAPHAIPDPITRSLGGWGAPRRRRLHPRSTTVGVPPQEARRHLLLGDPPPTRRSHIDGVIRTVSQKRTLAATVQTRASSPTAAPPQSPRAPSARGGRRPHSASCFHAHPAAPAPSARRRRGLCGPVSCGTLVRPAATAVLIIGRLRSLSAFPTATHPHQDLTCAPHFRLDSTPLPAPILKTILATPVPTETRIHHEKSPLRASPPGMLRSLRACPGGSPFGAD